MMSDEQKTIQEEAQILREKLRNERNNSTGQGSRGTGKSRRSSNAPIGSDSQDFGGNTSGFSGNSEGIDGFDRSTKGSSKRSGQDNGRSLDYGGSSPNGGYQTPRVAGLERTDPVPDMPPVKRGPGRPRKEQVIDKAAEIKKAIFKKKTPLTEKEATEYKEPLMHAMQSYGEYADRYIKWRTQQIDMADIWGNITDTEAEALANIMIRRGMRSAHAAEAVRNMVNGEDYISVAAMIVPRVIATTEEMKKVPPKPKRSKKRENLD